MAAGRSCHVSRCLPGSYRERTHSLSATQVHNDFPFTIIFLKKLTNDLLDGVHTQPVPTVDEWVAAHVFWRERFVVVRLTAQVQLGYASLGDNAAVIGLFLVSVEWLLVRRG
jgi:hypothetical protein